MAAFFQSLGKTVAAGFGLVVLMIVAVGALSGEFIRIGEPIWWEFFWRWLHIMAGLMWVGLLYYLNFVQTPTVPKIEPAEHRAAITRYIAPNVLFWFRYAALATVAFGLILAHQRGYLIQALTFRGGFHVIGIGMWLALIMAFNVWFIIWPKQKAALGLVEASPDAKAAAARVAGITSRVNMMLSVPMLYCMVAARNAGL